MPPTQTRVLLLLFLNIFYGRHATCGEEAKAETDVAGTSGVREEGDEACAE